MDHFVEQALYFPRQMDRERDRIVGFSGHFTHGLSQ
jgi:hypothetical protein